MIKQSPYECEHYIQMTGRCKHDNQQCELKIAGYICIDFNQKKNEKSVNEQ